MSQATRDPEGIDAKVEILRDPDTYPDAIDEVETVETHMAWVFLTERHARKLKKPVRLDFLDYGTVGARKEACEAEVRLNRRLAPDVYLGSERLSVTTDGKLTLGAGERTVDWLVKMRRLPRPRMLDEVVERGSAQREDLVALGRVLGEFYAGAEPMELTPERLRSRLRARLEENLTEVSRPEFAMDRNLIGAVGEAQRRFLDGSCDLLRQRLDEGRVVEGHGDLRPQHACLLDPPVVIDCIEFNRDFRIVDALDDLSFLWLECERLGAPEVGRWVIDVYADVAGDPVPDALTRFYRSARACLRAKLSLWHVEDEAVAVEQHAGWLDKARAYLESAAHHGQRIGR